MVLSRVTWVWWKRTVAFGTARISLLDEDSLGQLRWFFSRGQASFLVCIRQRLEIYTKLGSEPFSAWLEFIPMARAYTPEIVFSVLKTG